MSIVYTLPNYSRVSNRYSGRRTTGHYIQQGCKMGGAPIRQDSIRHVYRVRPNVLVNFVDPRPSRGQGWFPPPVEYRSSRAKHSEYEGDPSWKTTHSPHPRTMPLYGDEAHFDGFASMVDPYHPDAHLFQSSPSEEFYDADSFFEDASSQHVSSSFDSPTSSSPQSPERPASISSSNSEPTFYQGYPVDLYDGRRSPSLMEPPGRPDLPPRSRRMSFDSSGRSSTSSHGHGVRMVRFNENPVLPDPPARRQGWFNRRGDQLWNNNGAFRPASESNVYPPDLRNYPEPGMGWMNEEGTQIDMKRRLVRKKPLRSALKKTSL